MTNTRTNDSDSRKLDSWTEEWPTWSSLWQQIEEATEAMAQMANAALAPPISRKVGSHSLYEEPKEGSREVPIKVAKSFSSWDSRPVTSAPTPSSLSSAPSTVPSNPTPGVPSGFSAVAANHPYSTAFLIGAAFTGSCLLGAAAAKLAFGRGPRPLLIDKSLSDYGVRLKRLEEALKDAHTGQAKISEQLASRLAAHDVVGKEVTAMSASLANLSDQVLSARIAERLSGVEGGVAEARQRALGVSDLLKKHEASLQDIKKLAAASNAKVDSIYDAVLMSDKQSREALPRVLARLDAIEDSIADESTRNASAVESIKSLKLNELRQDVQEQLTKSAQAIEAAAEKSHKAMAAALGKKIRQDMKSFLDSLSQVESELSGLNSASESAEKGVSGGNSGAASTPSASWMATLRGDKPKDNFLESTTAKEQATQAVPPNSKAGSNSSKSNDDPFKHHVKSEQPVDIFGVSDSGEWKFRLLGAKPKLHDMHLHVLGQRIILSREAKHSEGSLFSYIASMCSFETNPFMTAVVFSPEVDMVLLDGAWWRCSREGPVYTVREKVADVQEE